MFLSAKVRLSRSSPKRIGSVEPYALKIPAPKGRNTSFESTLKVICTERKWPFDPAKDTSSHLLKIVCDRGFVPAYLQSQYSALRATLETGVPTVRNRAAG